MRKNALLLVPILLLAACASPSGGGGNGGGGGGGSDTYGFTANYACVSTNYGGAEDKAYGFISAVKNGGLDFYDSASLGGEDVPFTGNNQLSQVAPGSSVSFSMTIDGHTFTGSAVMPDELFEVDYDPVDHLVTWSNAALEHSAGYVTVRKSLTDASGAVTVPFGAGEAALPSDFDVSGKITVFATNIATNLAPDGTFETYSYFRVSRANGALNFDTFDFDPVVQ